MLEFLNKTIGLVNDNLWTYILIPFLVILGLFFTFKTGFVQLRYFVEMLKITFEKSSIAEDGKKKISSFGAFCIGAATRIGTGNIAGVAIAIVLGGPGAVFWMWVMSIFGAASAFIESTLAQIYKVKDKEGFKGGPAYYMQKGLNKRWMGVLFSILIIFCFGLVFNSVQANTIAISVESTFGISRAVTGSILVVLTGIIIFGGARKIARFSEVVVPVLALFYLGLAGYVMAINVTELPSMFKMIWDSAFGLHEAVGGTIGAALTWGIKRGLFANEAGMGSAPNAAATADTSHPVKQGLMQAFGVLTDTLVICSASAFIVLLSDAWQNTKLTGIELATASLKQNVGDWAGIFMTVTIFLFAFSSVIGNYYYGQTNLDFVRENKVLSLVYRLAVLGMVMVGAVASLDFVWGLADLFMALMCLTNLVAITLLSKVAFSALRDYGKQKKEGKEPVFYAENIPGLTNVECWDSVTTEMKKSEIGA
ncbi:alanine/glycine:cation symporter family protein [Bacillus cereus group sp. TH152-1LC]|uniref:alanine/glycine:cation symporter family protein n=1 Tax=Bacillus cereus group sp. TH152-1LC TaxID=3018060 RepID=UPI0022E4AC09|nr:alanine/glycine:cation symporter family protein [Bacillus cereus group sp. TH152-1LC]MDA1675398.1 alanine/glycine:cation symporter family protein [Bacillus cereus group sp. TH152-1LC]